MGAWRPALALVDVRLGTTPAGAGWRSACEHAHDRFTGWRCFAAYAGVSRLAGDAVCGLSPLAAGSVHAGGRLPVADCRGYPVFGPGAVVAGGGGSFSAAGGGGVGAGCSGGVLAPALTGGANDMTLKQRLARGGITVTGGEDRKSTRLNSSHVAISYAVFC